MSLCLEIKHWIILAYSAECINSLREVKKKHVFSKRIGCVFYDISDPDLLLFTAVCVQIIIVVIITTIITKSTTFSLQVSLSSDLIKSNM